MTAHGGRRAAVVLLALLAATAGLVALPPARAATRVVTLTDAGPSPARLVLARGEQVRFRNGDSLQHRVTSGSGWKFDSGTLAPGATSAATPALTTPGTYSYTDARLLLLTLTTFPGSLVVPAATPSPTAAASTPAPPPASTTPAPAPSSTAVPTLPPPTAAPTLSPVPLPTVTLPGPVVVPPSSSASPAPDIRYGGPQALVQGSPHRYGLPALLGLVGVGGVASLLLRVLLWLAPGAAGSRRTG